MQILWMVGYHAMDRRLPRRTLGEPGCRDGQTGRQRRLGGGKPYGSGSRRAAAGQVRRPHAGMARHAKHCLDTVRHIAPGEPSQGGMPAASSALRAGAASPATRAPCAKGDCRRRGRRPLAAPVAGTLQVACSHAPALCWTSARSTPASRHGKAPHCPATRSPPLRPVHGWPVGGVGAISLSWIGCGQ